MINIIRNCLLITFLYCSVATQAQQLPGQFNNYTIIEKAGLYGIAENQSGDTILPCEYDYICTSGTSFKGLYIRRNDTCLIFDPIIQKFSKPNEINPANPYNLYPMTITPTEKQGFVNGDGKVIIEGQWDYAANFRESIARVVDNNGEKTYLLSDNVAPSPGKTGYINTSGDYIIPPIFSYIDMFPSPNHRVTRFTRAKYECDDDMGCENPYKSGKWGLINDRGEIVLQDNIYTFIDRGFIDPNSKELIFLVERGDKSGIINHQGKIVFPLASYSSLEQTWNAYIVSLK